MNWLLFFVVVHITAVIVGFGPTFAFPFIGMETMKMPQHVPLSVRIQNTVADKLIVPLSIVVGLSGAAIVLVGGVSLTKSWYLIIAILLYLSALYIGIVILGGNGHKMSKMIDAMSPGGPPPSADESQSPGVAPSGARPAQAGPPPEFLKLIAENRMFGTINHALVLVIILLMIIKPGGLHTGPLFG